MEKDIQTKPQIINVRGTSGSGKTWIVKAIMEKYPAIEPIHEEGRKKPLVYECKAVGVLPLIVLGHYDTACGGCDTLKTRDQVFGLARDWHAKGYNVLFEGLMIGGEVNRTVELPDCTVINLTTDVGICVQSVIDRRLAAGNDKPFNEKNTVNKKKEVDRATQRIINDKRCIVFQMDRADAYAMVEQILNLTGEL